MFREFGNNIIGGIGEFLADTAIDTAGGMVQEAVFNGVGASDAITAVKVFNEAIKPEKDIEDPIVTELKKGKGDPKIIALNEKFGSRMALKYLAGNEISEYGPREKLMILAA